MVKGGEEGQRRGRMVKEGKGKISTDILLIKHVDIYA